METVSTPQSSRAIGPYSQAMQVDGWVYTSGAVGLTPEGTKIGPGVREQTEQTLNNLTAVLGAAGCTLQDVVKATVYLADMDDFTAMNEIYARFFGEHKPARSCVEVARLPIDMRVEIDVVARIPQD